LLELYYRPDADLVDPEVKDRLLFRQVIEALKCLQTGVLRTVADGNIGSIMGIGAPAWTGGLIQFVNTYGLQRFIDRCNELAARYGDRFEVPHIVHDKLAAGELFE
jgi:3-hydroxyacyl-CoA dehydrogenase/enoyl-CoA hydratase/3-hydroxybutyryl-CoA epimerase